MREIKESKLDYELTIRADDLKGKRVLAKNGKEIGKISEIRLDPGTFSFTGIKVNRGLLELDAFIGKEYIDSVSADGAILNITPVTDYEGLKVFDSDGKPVGKVREIRREGNTNNISAIVVDRGILKNDVVLSKSDVKSVGESIILNVPIEENLVKVGGVKI
ncbi:MAG: PRC-barrel domain-containing protein [Candidatus Diapherotrites archaeon]|nr:PRC-barrel domain-containing protein [Candidatus Diapherotrites archaeon]